MRKLSKRDWCGTRQNLHSLTLLLITYIAKTIRSFESKTEIQLRAKSNLKNVCLSGLTVALTRKQSELTSCNVHLEDYELYTKLIKFLTSRSANDRYIKRMNVNASEKSRFVESFGVYMQPPFPLYERICFCSKQFPLKRPTNYVLVFSPIDKWIKLTCLLPLHNFS